MRVFRKAPESPVADALRTDRTFAVTVGKYGGFYVQGSRQFWRVCLGWVALTFLQDDFLAAVRAYADVLERPK